MVFFGNDEQDEHCSVKEKEPVGLVRCRNRALWNSKRSKEDGVFVIKQM
jgi:hypothetical protein